MITGRHIRCILFDLGSTLWYTVDRDTWLRLEEASSLRAAETLLRFTNGKKFTSMEAHTLGSLLQEAVDKQIRFRSKQKAGYEPDFVEATREALQQIGVKNVNHALAEAIYEALRIRIPKSRELFEDTISTLSALKQRGYMLGVVTNRRYGGQPFYEDLQTMGLLDYFDYEHMAISADLGIRKPNPDIFLHALNGLNVQPGEAAMVGDSLKADILGAKLLNMLAIWKPRAALREEVMLAWAASKGVSVEVDPTGFTDNDLLGYVQNRDSLKLQQFRIEIKPDIIIDNLGALLTIFRTSA